jgi:N-acetylmuramoyl-L-alanine amidase
VIITAGGVVVPVIATKQSSWIVRTPCGQSTILSAEAASVLIDRVDVVLDPGHGGPTEAGAVGANGVVEARIDLAVGRLAAAKLESAGYRVLLTRGGDYRVPIASRAAIADALEAPLVSIHHNGGMANPSKKPGTEVIYQRDDAESRRLAGLIWEESMVYLGAFATDWVAGGDAGATYRLGIDDNDFYGIVREPASAAVLAEMSYIGHASEAALLADPEFLDVEAQAIAEGIRRWLESADAGSGFVKPSYRLTSRSGGGGSIGCVDPSLD